MSNKSMTPEEAYNRFGFQKELQGYEVEQLERIELNYTENQIYKTISPKQWAKVMKDVTTGGCRLIMHKIIGYEYQNEEKIYKSIREHLDEKEKKEQADDVYMLYWMKYFSRDEDEVREMMGINPQKENNKQ